MTPQEYEIRVHVRDVTSHINTESEAGRQCLKLCGGQAWEIWAYMPAFGAHYCSFERQTSSMLLGAVAQSQLAYPEGIADLPEDELAAWREEVEEEVRTLTTGTEPWEMFNVDDALKNSFDFTLDHKGERWADYEELEEAMRALDEGYDAGKSRSDLEPERKAVHEAVEGILKAVLDHYNCNDLGDAVLQFQKGK
jgi:hypothetical protein